MWTDVELLIFHIYNLKKHISSVFHLPSFLGPLHKENTLTKLQNTITSNNVLEHKLITKNKFSNFIQTSTKTLDKKPKAGGFITVSLWPFFSVNKIRKIPKTHFKQQDQLAHFKSIFQTCFFFFRKKDTRWAAALLYLCITVALTTKPLRFQPQLWSTINQQHLIYLI